MGYRSDVSITVYGKHKPMMGLLAAQKLTNSVWMEDEYEQYSYYDNDGELCLMIQAKFEGVKWYDGFYKEVDSWNQLVADTHSRDDICSEFIRIGEEHDDMTETYHGDGCVGYTFITRTLGSYGLPAAIVE